MDLDVITGSIYDFKDKDTPVQFVTETKRAKEIWDNAIMQCNASGKLTSTWGTSFICLYANEWSDGFEPHFSVQANKGSAWLKTVTISPSICLYWIVRLKPITPLICIQANEWSAWHRRQLATFIVLPNLPRSPVNTIKEHSYVSHIDCVADLLGHGMDLDVITCRIDDFKDKDTPVQFVNETKRAKEIWDNNAIQWKWQAVFYMRHFTHLLVCKWVEWWVWASLFSKGKQRECMAKNCNNFSTTGKQSWLELYLSIGIWKITLQPGRDWRAICLRPKEIKQH